MNEKAQPAASRIRGPEKIWGAPPIAAALGVSIDTVYRMAKDGSCPIYQPGGRYFAFRHELENWLRGQPVEWKGASS